jgi:hypothetical protein
VSDEAQEGEIETTAREAPAGGTPDDGDGDTGGSGGDARTRPAGSPSRYRRAGFAVARGIAVLAVAAVGYQLVVPTVHVERGRLSRLVLSKPGLAAFDKAKPQAAEQPDTQTQLAAMTTAAKRSPNKTGIYSIQWVPTQTTGVGIVAFLLPSNATAATVVSELKAQQLSAGSFSSSGLTRTSTFTVAGVPDSSGAVYAPASKAGASVPGLAVTVLRSGRVVALSDAATSNSTDQASVDKVTVAEYDHLHNLGSGFTLSVTRRPVVATWLWVAGALVLATIAALAPVVRRRRAERRRLAHEEMAANQVIVGRRVIVKHRR